MTQRQARGIRRNFRCVQSQRQPVVVGYRTLLLGQDRLTTFVSKSKQREKFIDAKHPADIEIVEARPGPYCETTSTCTVTSEVCKLRNEHENPGFRFGRIVKH